MRLRHIEVIQAILQTGNFAAAAELLQLPEPEVRALVQDAEQQSGYLLFASVRGRLQATRETRMLQPEIDRLHAHLEPLKRLASSLLQHQDAPLRVVGTPALTQYLLPQCLASLRRRFRETPCQLTSQHPHEVVKSLLLSENELGLSLHHPEHPQLRCEELAQARLQLLAPHGWLKPRQKYIALQELAGQSMIGIEGQDPLSQLLASKMQALRPAPVIQTRVQTYPMMRSMVESGEGLAIVDPFTAVGAKASGLDVCPLSPPIIVTLYALTRCDQQPSAALRALLEILREKAVGLLEA